jgi:hypothetical protein
VSGEAGRSSVEPQHPVDGPPRSGLSRGLSIAWSAAGCEQPIRLVGRSTRINGNTGEVLTEFNTTEATPGYVLVPCGNRRTGRCEPCSQTYKADTYHLVRAGLIGGRGVPEDVRDHLRLFVTLTAPSFGPVHSRRPGVDGRTRPCRPRRKKAGCRHGRPLACTARHAPDDPALGQPLCPRCYDYVGAVLWNAHTGDLWRRTTIYIRDEMAKRAGISRTALQKQLRLSYVKVAEFQARGVVHFHVIVRADGPEGPSTPAPEWADLVFVAESVRAATSCAQLRLHALGGMVIRWGSELDIRQVIPEDEEGRVTEQTVAAYVVKYATKAAEVSGTVDRPIKSAGAITNLRVSEHTRSMISTAWDLGGRREFRRLRLRRWAHMLGYRGHFSTKSRVYSTTLGALRQVRADYRAAEHAAQFGLDSPDVVTTVDAWGYAGQGYLSEVEAEIAATIRVARQRRKQARDEGAASTP